MFYRDFRVASGSPIFAAMMGLVTAIAIIGVSVCPASAQSAGTQPSPPTGTAPAQQLVAPPPPPSPLAGIEFLITPYLWAPWTDVRINPSDTRIPSASGTVSFGKFLNHLTWVPFMGAAEIRDGDFALYVDDIHAPLRAGLTTKNILFGGGTGGLVLDGGLAMFYYRAFKQPDQYLDVGVGVAPWGINGDISFNRGLLPGFSATNGVSWADPVIGVRYHHDLPNGIGVTGSGDVGGFGLGAHIDWQVAGTFDFPVNSSLDLHAGFRSINIVYGLPRSGLDLHFYGPIVAATFRF